MKGVKTVEEMIEILWQIGLPEAECERIREQYRDDLDGLAAYVLYMRAVLDDRGQYYE